MSLGSSKQSAINRFQFLKKKNSNIKRTNMYKEFIKEYISLRYVTEMKSRDLNSLDYYLPHHSVLELNYAMFSVVPVKPTPEYY